MSAERPPELEPIPIKCPLDGTVCYEVDPEGQRLSEPQCEIGYVVLLSPVGLTEEGPTVLIAGLLCGKQLDPLQRMLVKVSMETGAPVIIRPEEGKPELLRAPRPPSEPE